MCKVKTILAISLGILATSAVFVDTMPSNLPLSNNTFRTGEELNFKVHYGFINAAKASFRIDNNLHKQGDKTCYKVEIEGRTIGSEDFFSKVRDKWGSYIDTATMIPEKSYRNIQEGKYDLKEVVWFYQDKGVAVRNVDNVKKEQYNTPKNVHDIVSGYYYLRQINFEKYNVGDTVKILAFFENKNFDFKLKYLGKTQVKTDNGKFRAILLSPIMPKNDLFSGENSVKLWMSDDQNKIPLLCKTSTVLGTIDVDLESYKGLRYPLTSKIN